MYCELKIVHHEFLEPILHCSIILGSKDAKILVNEIEKLQKLQNTAEYKVYPNLRFEERVVARHKESSLKAWQYVNIKTSLFGFNTNMHEN